MKLGRASHVWGEQRLQRRAGVEKRRGRKCVRAHVYCPIAGVYGLKQQMEESQSMSRKKVISS
ncbi:hypothetical protein Pyn_28607 [Prunus yedoensis var. nudiflora]|uniref:Uncharacterized protein n=1 Tax=Prunus yedoensis var. nudiflora TaxID=2094558 RepID=A0A314ZMP3_PRUYE|nr:hypothetical protein Pyn_28607 [Prunus yedoensis var. nudiflora]